MLYIIYITLYKNIILYTISPILESELSRRRFVFVKRLLWFVVCNMNKYYIDKGAVVCFQ